MELVAQFVHSFMVAHSPVCLRGAAAVAWLSSTKQSINLQHTHALLSLIWHACTEHSGPVICCLGPGTFVCNARAGKKFQPRLSFIYLFYLFVSLFVMLWTVWPLVVVVCLKVSNWRRKTLLARQQQSDVLCAHLDLQVSAYFPQSAYVRGTFVRFALEKAAVCHLRRLNLHFFPETKIVRRPF